MHIYDAYLLVPYSGNIGRRYTPLRTRGPLEATTLGGVPLANQIWVNLPVKNLGKSEEFFSQIGFSVNRGPGNSDDCARIVIGDENVIVMLFPESTLERFIGTKIADTTQGTEMVLTIGADSKGEVDEMIAKVIKAGGSVYGNPSDNGWMYGAGFVDLDGHRWNLLYMDMSKMPNV